MVLGQGKHCEDSFYVYQPSYAGSSITEDVSHEPDDKAFGYFIQRRLEYKLQLCA